MNCSETRWRQPLPPQHSPQAGPPPSPKRRGGAEEPPLPPAPSPKRRGGADTAFLPLSASGRGLGGGVLALLLLSLSAPAAGPQRLTSDGKLKSAPVFASSQ